MRPSRPNRRTVAALFVDRWLGALLCGALRVVKRLTPRRPSPPAPEDVSRILVVKMWGMGSIVLASPMLREIERRHPKARIDFVTLRENEAILPFYPQVRATYLPDLSRGIAPFLIDTLRTLRRVRRERYDLLLDLEFFTRFSAIFSFLARARFSHGFSSKGSGRGKLHDVEVPFNVYKHVAANFVALLRGSPTERPLAFDPAGAEVLAGIEAPPEAGEGCRRALEDHPAWRAERSLVVVNPNAGDMALERRWPAERVGELLEALAARGDLNLVLSGSPSERSYVESICEGSAFEQDLINLAGRLTIPEFVALLARADVLVTNDSGPLHIGCAAGVSCVALFGPETPMLYGPLRSREAQQHAVHYLGLACSPCMFVHNNKVLSCWFAHAKCMTGIGASSVYASVVDLLQRGDATREQRPPLRALD